MSVEEVKRDQPKVQGAKATRQQLPTFKKVFTHQSDPSLPSFQFGGDFGGNLDRIFTRHFVGNQYEPDFAANVSHDMQEDFSKYMDDLIDLDSQSFQVNDNNHYPPTQLNKAGLAQLETMPQKQATPEGKMIIQNGRYIEEESKVFNELRSDLQSLTIREDFRESQSSLCNLGQADSGNIIIKDGGRDDSEL